VFIAVWNLHHSEDLWDEPNAFNPMRWKKKFENPKMEVKNGIIVMINKHAYAGQTE
jgi:cytochrome P450